MKLGLIAVALAAVVAACGSVAGSGGSGSGSPDPSPTPMKSVMVTRADNQQTVTAHVGDRVQIALGTDFDWHLEQPDGIVLAHDRVQNYMLVRGTQAIWLARSAGRSTITASGSVNCPSGQPCALLLAVFKASVVVLP